MCNKGLLVSTLEGEQAATTVVSGFERRKISIEVGLLFLSVVYGSVYYSDPKIFAASEFCPEGETRCQRPDLVAYKVVSAMCMIYMGLMGVYNWHCTRRMKELGKKSTSAGVYLRLFGYLEAADHQNVAIFCYQVWDFCVSLTIPEHMEFVFLVHHVLAALTAWFSMEKQMVPYYSVYFGGCSELSSIFLVFADLDLFFPPSPASSYEVFILACKALFTLTFAYYRVFGWWQVSASLWSDCLEVLRTGDAEKYRPGQSSFLYFFLGMSVLLGALQIYWFGLIVEKIVEILSDAS
jgi:hypothetical protein